ncbi:hypothetical protein PsorP6_001943 [Peronosclerospora sorghi]|uniref:Uncharacterized protein n=1 Tax=Peronosclerospora sorghi TaxID=230839 RepID=A0ACC0WW44_9STRA|nr:hypothetical protein PsorP6_001943 [Peronosclerospora sorghi]
MTTLERLLEALLEKLHGEPLDAFDQSSALESIEQLAHSLSTRKEVELQTLVPLVPVVQALSRTVIKRVARAAAETNNVKALVGLNDRLVPLVRLFVVVEELGIRQATQEDKEVAQWLPFVLTACYFIIIGADGPSATNAMQSVVLAQEAIDKALLLTRAPDRETLVAKYVAQMVALCAHDVDKQEWITVTSMNKKVMLRIVEQVHFPHLGGDLLGRLLALTFPLIDDLSDPTQLIGAQVLCHIIKNVTTTELRWYSDVLLEVLQTAIVSRKPATLDVLLDCLVESLIKISPPGELKHYDRFMPRLLRDTSLCSDVALRIIFVRHLRPLIVRQGAPHSLNIIRYLQPLLKVLLAGFESVNVDFVLEILETVRATVLAAWPRIAAHTEKILVGVLRAVAYCVLFDEDAAFTPTPTQKKRLLAQCEHVVDLLHQVHAGKQSSVCDMLASVSSQNPNLSPFCDRMLATFESDKASTG